MSRKGSGSTHDDAAAGRSALLRLLRFVLIAVIVLVTFFYVLDIGQDPRPLGDWEVRFVTGWPWVLLFALTLAFGVIAIDMLTPEKKIATLSGVFFGIVAGVVASIALSFLVDRIAEAYSIEGLRIITTVKILLGIAAIYLCVSIVLQTQDQFRLVIPYVEFSKQIRGPIPLLLDTSAIIDGRVLEVGRTGMIQSPIIVPKFVVDELQRLADSSDAIKRARGRRGLDLVGRLQREPLLDVQIDETEVPGSGVDQMLIELAAKAPGTIVTSDTGLDRVAGIKGVATINLNDLARAMRPTVVPGETIELRLVRVGAQPEQGVGYLDDGTMVVAEDGADRVGEMVRLRVTSSLQTAAGRMIFTRIRDREHGPAGADAGAPEHPPMTDGAPGDLPAASGEDPGAVRPARRDPRRAKARNPRR